MFTEEKKTEIYEIFAPKIQGYLYKKTSDPELARDLCSDVFIKIFSKLDTFDESKASLSTWIYHITQNTLFDYFRTRKVTVDLDDVPEIPDDKDSVEESICKEESLEELADALLELDERLRDLIVLHYYGGYSLKEVALKLGISYSYVKILHSNALKELKEILR